MRTTSLPLLAFAALNGVSAYKCSQGIISAFPNLDIGLLPGMINTNLDREPTCCLVPGPAILGSTNACRKITSATIRNSPLGALESECAENGMTPMCCIVPKDLNKVAYLNCEVIPRPQN